MFSLPQDFAARFGTTGRSSMPGGELPQPLGLAADGVAQRRFVGGTHVDQALDAAFAQAPRRDRSDTPQRVDWQLLEEVLHAFRRDDGQAVGLLPRRCDLREKLVGCDPGRRREPDRLANLGLQPLRYDAAERLAPRVLGHIQVRLVERQRLDERRNGAKELRRPRETPTGSGRSRAGR